MPNANYITALRLQTAGRFRDGLAKSKVTPHFPQSAERELARVLRDYDDRCNTVIARFLPRLSAAIRRQQGFRADAQDETPDAVLADIEAALRNLRPMKKLRTMLEKVAALEKKLSVAQWERVCKRTLGIDLMKDYYNGDFFKTAIADWVDENVNLIVTIEKEKLGKMREIVRDSFDAAARPQSIAKQISNAYETTAAHALFTARDQAAKLNSEITQKQQSDAGVRFYIWDTSRDQRVRKTHRHAQALYFRWDDPTVYSDDKGKTWRNKDLKFPNIKGKFVHVGRDFQCRCVAIPVFETEGIDQIPVGAVDWKAVDKRMTKKETAP